MSSVGNIVGRSISASTLSNNVSTALSTTIATKVQGPQVLSTRSFSNRRLEVVTDSRLDSDTVGRVKNKSKPVIPSAPVELYDLATLAEEWNTSASFESRRRREKEEEDREKAKLQQRKKVERHNTFQQRIRQEEENDFIDFGFVEPAKKGKKPRAKDSEDLSKFLLRNASKTYVEETPQPASKNANASQKQPQAKQKITDLAGDVQRTLRKMDRSRFEVEAEANNEFGFSDAIADTDTIVEETYPVDQDDLQNFGTYASESAEPLTGPTRVVALTRALRKVGDKKEIIHTLGTFMGSFDVMPAYSQDLQRAAKSIARIRDKVAHRQPLELLNLLVDKLDPHTKLTELLNVNRAKGTYRAMAKRARDAEGAFGTALGQDEITLGMHRTGTKISVPDTVAFNVLIKALVQEAALAFPRNYHQTPALPCVAQAVPPQTHAAVGEHKGVSAEQVLKEKEKTLADKKAKYLKGLKNYHRLTPTPEPALELGYQPHLHPAIVCAVRTLDYMWYMHENPDAMVTYLHEREKRVREDAAIEKQRDESLLKKYIADTEKKLQHLLEKGSIDSKRKASVRKQLEELRCMREKEDDEDEDLSESDADEFGVKAKPVDGSKRTKEDNVSLARARLLAKAKTKAALKDRFPGVFTDPLLDKEPDLRDYVREELQEKYGITKEEEDSADVSLLDAEDMKISEMLVAAVGDVMTKPTITSLMPLAALAADAGDMVLTHAILLRAYHWNVLPDTALRIAELTKRGLAARNPELAAEMGLDVENEEDDDFHGEDAIAEAEKLAKQLDTLKYHILTGLSGQKPYSLAQLSQFEAFWQRTTRVRWQDAEAVAQAQQRQLDTFMQSQGSDPVAAAVDGVNGAGISAARKQWPSWLWPSADHARALSQLAIFESVDFAMPAPPMPVAPPGKLAWPMLTPTSMSLEQIMTALKACTFAQAYENAFLTEQALRENLKLLRRAREAVWVQEEEMRKEVEAKEKERKALEVKGNEAAEAHVEEYKDKDGNAISAIEAGTAKASVAMTADELHKRDQMVAQLCQRRTQQVGRLLQCAEGWLNVLQARVLVATVRAKQHYTLGALARVEEVLRADDEAFEPEEPPTLPTLQDTVTAECMEELLRISKALSYHAHGLSLAHVRDTPQPFIDMVSMVLPLIDRTMQQLARWGIVSMRPFTLSPQYESLVPPSPISFPLSAHESIDNMLSCIPRNRLVAPLPAPGRKFFLDLGSGDGEHALQHAKTHPNDTVVACDILSHRMAAMLLHARVETIPALAAAHAQTSVDDLVNADTAVEVLEYRAKHMGRPLSQVIATLKHHALVGGQQAKENLPEDNIIPASKQDPNMGPVALLKDILPSELVVDAPDTNLNNLYAYTGSALDLLGAVPSASVDTIHIMHPPPPTPASYAKVPQPNVGNRIQLEDLAVTLPAQDTLLSEQLLWGCARAMKQGASVYILSDDARVGAWLNTVVPFDDNVFNTKPDRRAKKGKRGAQPEVAFVASREQLPINVPKLEDLFEVEELDVSDMHATGFDQVRSRYQRLALTGQLQSRHSHPDVPSRAWRIVRTNRAWE